MLNKYHIPLRIVYTEKDKFVVTALGSPLVRLTAHLDENYYDKFTGQKNTPEEF